jgi:uncharacterized membrane protein
MPALARLSPAQGVLAMQSINVTAVTPPFMSVFFGTAGLAVLATVLAGDSWLLWLGSALYVFGVIGLTAVCNVPRNNALAGVAPGDAETALHWARYVSEWTAWNHVRTAAALGAAVSFILPPPGGDAVDCENGRVMVHPHRHSGAVAPHVVYSVGNGLAHRGVRKVMRQTQDGAPYGCQRCFGRSASPCAAMRASTLPL